MIWHDKRVLITGAAGFIGSHLTEALLARGAKVRAFIRYNSRNGRGNLEDLEQSQLEEIEIMAGDLRDADAVKRAVRDCDLVFHLGALIGIPYSFQNPREVVETNLLGTLNILTAARANGQTKVIHTSTSEVYGSACYVPIDESHPLQGQSPYAASKIGADKLVESFHASFELPVVTVRPFNSYGPRQSARAVIPTLISQALCSDEIRLGNTEARRDFTFVTDTVAGYLAAAACDGALGQVFNIGAGREITIGQLAEVILASVDKPARLVIDQSRIRPGHSEVTRLLADNTRAKEILAWQPAVPFEEGIRRTVAWVAAHLNRFQVGKYQI